MTQTNQNTMDLINSVTSSSLDSTTALTPPPFRLIKGFEMEVNNAFIDQTARALRQAGIRYVIVKGDPSENVDCEVVFPPLRIDDQVECDKYIKPVQQIVERLGGRIRVNCGGHVHVGMKPLMLMSDKDFNEAQIAHWNLHTNTSLSAMHGSYISPNVTLGTLLPFELIKCAIKLYGSNQEYISSMLPNSRRFHRWAYPINNKTNKASFDNARSINDLMGYSVDLTKRSAVNVVPFTSYQTIEFRQGASTLSPTKLSKWCQVLEHLFQSSNAFRIDHSAINNVETRTVETTTPDSIGRNGSFINEMYDMCRNQNNGFGATIEELMGRFGRGAQNIRSRISEFRRELGHGAIVTHTQQANGNVYGDGEIYCRYQILRTFQKIERIQNNNVSLVDNVDYNFFIGLDSNLKTWIDARISQLA